MATYNNDVDILHSEGLRKVLHEIADNRSFLLESIQAQPETHLVDDGPSMRMVKTGRTTFFITVRDII